ncbi:UNVERIFIED_CONTAM: LCP family protein [Halobacillus marinus]
MSLFFVLLIAIGAAGGYALYLTDQVKQTATESHQELDRGDKSEKRTKAVNPGSDHISVLFVGVDETAAEAPSRSDALVLATFNDENKSIKMVNIPRDSYTYIPEVGYQDKITHAHAFGGVDATVETVEQMLDVPVDYYVRLDFQSFVDIVDAIGGITYDVPFDMTEQDSSREAGVIKLEEGVQLLNGEEALALARTRKYDSDLARGQRQMDIIQEIISETISTRSLNNMDSILTSVSENMKTNLTFDEMISFKDYLLQKDGLDFDKLQLDGEGMYINGGWYYQVDQESLTTTIGSLKTHLDMDQPFVETDEPELSPSSGEEQAMPNE